MGLAATVAAGIIGGIVLRGTAVLGDARPAVFALLVFLAVLAGMLMPLVSYLSVAGDGSAVSRERDGIAAELDHDLDTFFEVTKECRAALMVVAEIRHTLDEKELPNICRTVQATIDEVHASYTTARLIIGGLTADPPARTSPTVQYDGAGVATGYIGTGLPGARTVDLAPLVDRVRRLRELDQRRDEIEQRLEALTHPWASYSASV